MHVADFHRAPYASEFAITACHGMSASLAFVMCSGLLRCSGAAKGIGLACASCLGHEGAKVVVADVDEEGAKR